MSKIHAASKLNNRNFKGSLPPTNNIASLNPSTTKNVTKQEINLNYENAPYNYNYNSNKNSLSKNGKITPRLNSNTSQSKDIEMNNFYTQENTIKYKPDINNCYIDSHEHKKKEFRINLSGKGSGNNNVKHSLHGNELDKNNSNKLNNPNFNNNSNNNQGSKTKPIKFKKQILVPPKSTTNASTNSNFTIQNISSANDKITLNSNSQTIAPNNSQVQHISQEKVITSNNSVKHTNQSIISEIDSINSNQQSIIVTHPTSGKSYNFNLN